MGIETSALRHFIESPGDSTNNWCKQVVRNGKSLLNSLVPVEGVRGRNPATPPKFNSLSSNRTGQQILNLQARVRSSPGGPFYGR
jgi:hypothetical protein